MPEVRPGSCPTVGGVGRLTTEADGSGLGFDNPPGRVFGGIAVLQFAAFCASAGLIMCIEVGVERHTDEGLPPGFADVGRADERMLPPILADKGVANDAGPLAGLRFLVTFVN